MVIQFVAIVSISIRSYAFFRAVKLVKDARDWWLFVLPGLVGIALSIQITYLYDNINTSHAFGVDPRFELLGLLASSLVLGIVIYFERMISRYHDVSDKYVWQNRHLIAAESFAKVGGWAYNVETMEREWSDGFIRLIGMDVTDSNSMAVTYDKIIHPEDLLAFTEYVKTFPREGKSQIQHRTHPDHGPIRFLSTHIELVNDNEGRPKWVYGLTHDISELKAKEEELENRNRDLELLHTIGLELTSHINLPDVFEVVVKTLVKTIDEIDGACIWLRSDDREKVLPRACCARTGNEKEILENINKIPELLRLIKNNDDITFIPDTSSHWIFQQETGRMSNIKSLGGVPIMVNNEPVGFVMVVSFSQANAICRENGLWLMGISNEVAVAVEKTQLFEFKNRLARQRLNDLEDERRRLALELHDDLGAELTSLGLKLHRGGEDKLLLNDAIESINTLIEKVRSMSLELRPMVLDDLGLVPALKWLFDRYTRQTDITVNFYEELSNRERPDIELETVAFRVVQEAITNVARHANTNTVQVLIHHNESSIAIHIVDEGKGFNPGDQFSRYISVGIEGMRERVSLLEGTFDIVSEPEVGTRITVVLPVSGLS